MKTGCFHLPSSTRLAISELLIIVTVLTLLFPSYAGFAKSRGEVSSSNSTIEPAAPQNPVIVVNKSGDASNLNPSAGCDTDAATPGEQCTLRAALERANALAGDDEIRFNIPLSEPNCETSSGHCLIYLTGPLPPLGTNLRIEGPGPDKVSIRRSTGGDYRIFTVTFATDVTISGVALSNGRPFGNSSGGAIANAGSATVNVVNSYLSANVAGAEGGDGGAIANASSGTINVINSTIADNTAPVPVVNGANGGGGGILNASTGTINVTNSKIIQNKVVGGRSGSVLMGGGIYNASTGTVNVTNSVLSYNEVTIGAGGANGGGGGLANANTGSVTITNSIISDNIVSGGDTTGLKGAGVLNASTGTVNFSNGVIFKNFVSGSGSGGGIANTSGNLNVSNSTITGNRGLGGGLFGQGTVKSTVIALNNAGPGTGSDVSGSFTSAGFNFLGVEDGSTGFNAATDQKGTVASPLNPKFDPNGTTVPIVGPTLTVPGFPLCGSPVVDKGTSAGLGGPLPTDVRGEGYPRTIDDPNTPNVADGTDVGAFERTACVQTAFTVNTTGDADDVSPGDGNCDSDAVAAGSQCSLRAALRESNAIAGDYIINFSIPTNDPGYDPTTGKHTINLSSALPEITNSNLTLNGPSADRLIVRRHSGGFYGILKFGGVVETATISGLTINNGFSQGDGGGVSFAGQTLNISGCVFSNNTSAASGGAISAFASSKVNVTDSTFSDNSASASTGFSGGGGVFVRGALSVSNSAFNDNFTNALGGAINIDNSSGGVDSNITNSVFNGNSADAGGGVAVGTFGSVMRVINSTFTRNISTVVNSQGGGIFHFFGALEVNGSTLSSNQGFGIAVSSGNNITTSISDSTIDNNTGGGIQTELANVPTGTLNVVNSTIIGNTGGPGIKPYRTTLNVSNSTISHNENGGIMRTIADNQGTWTVKSSIIAGNGGSIGDLLGAFLTGGFNVIGNADLATGFSNGVANDQVGSSALPLDPKFDPAGLQDNGGPTKTIALLPGSVAIDKGTSTGLTRVLTTDQRGFARTFDDPAEPNGNGDGTDIGAFELQPGTPTPSPTPTPTPTPTPNPSPTPTPTPSPSPTPTPQPPAIALTITPLVRTKCGDIALGITVQNIGGSVANNVTIPNATLAGPRTVGTPLPINLGNLGAGQSATAVLTFSGMNNGAGAKKTLHVDGTFTDGTFVGDWKVTLP